MAEQSANVYRINASAATAAAWIEALGDVINMLSMRWIVLDARPGKLLLSCNSTSAQVVFVAGTGQNMSCGYEPDGSLVDADSIPSSGLRPLTGGGAASMSGAESQLLLAEYEDALAVIIKSSTAWLYAAHVGAIVNPLDESDIARGYQHGLLVGFPRDSIVAGGSWLFGSTTGGYATSSSCLYLGSKAWGTISADLGKSAATANLLSRVGIVERFIPFFVRPRDGAGTAMGLTGALKYLRQWRGVLSHESRLFSGTPGSEQAWIGWVTSPVSVTGDSGARVLLWGKTETVI